MGYVKRQVVFNEDNRQQRELYEWVIAQGGGENFSGFVRTVLFAYKNGGGAVKRSDIPEVYTFVDDEQAAMNDIF